ncbi:hypothetical protein Tco_1168164 [Tanacetum coccineum]
MTWVPKESWSGNRVPYEIIDQFCIPFLEDGWNEERDIQDEREPMYDHDIGDLENDLVRDNAPYHANEEEDQYKEGRCKLLGDPNQEPPTCKIKRFEVIKYSFGPAEEFVAIKVCRYNDWKKTEEDVCRAYQDILAKMDKVGS